MNDVMMKHPIELSKDQDSNPWPLVHKASMLPLTRTGRHQRTKKMTENHGWRPAYLQTPGSGLSPQQFFYCICHILWRVIGEFWHDIICSEVWHHFMLVFHHGKPTGQKTATDQSQQCKVTQYCVSRTPGHTVQWRFSVGWRPACPSTGRNCLPSLEGVLPWMTSQCLCFIRNRKGIQRIFLGYHLVNRETQLRSTLISGQPVRSWWF